MNSAINFSVDGLAKVLVNNYLSPLTLASAILDLIFCIYGCPLPPIFGCFKRKLSYSDNIDA
jgi:hypothetical protein